MSSANNPSGGLSFNHPATGNQSTNPPLQPTPAVPSSTGPPQSILSSHHPNQPGPAQSSNAPSSSTPSSGLLRSQMMDSSFPSFYMNHRDSLSNSLPAATPSDSANRPRGDSIFLPPPINMTTKFGSSDYDPTAAAAANASSAANAATAYNPGATASSAYNPASNYLSGSGSGASRSNSIFSSLIQLPGSNGNSISGPSSSAGAKLPAPSASQPAANTPNSAGGIAKSRQFSIFPNSSAAGDYQLTTQDLENYFGKESLGNLLNWNSQRQQSVPPHQMQQQLQQLQQQQLQQQLQQQQQHQHQQQVQPQQFSISGLGGSIGKKGSRGSMDLSGNSFWEGLNNGLSGSLAGLPITNDGLNGILAGLSNGSIDFSGMSNEQRRDSILKIINDQQLFQQQRTPSNSSSSNTKTTLREDIFDKSKSSNPNGKQTSKTNAAGSKLGPTAKDSSANLAVPSNDKNSASHHLSPTSSMSSKSSHKYDEPQSPKTSPTMFNSRVQASSSRQAPQKSNQAQSQPVVYPNYSYQYPNYLNQQPASHSNYPPQYVQPQYQYQTQLNQYPQQVPQYLKSNQSSTSSPSSSYAYQSNQQRQPQYVPPAATNSSPSVKRARTNKGNAILSPNSKKDLVPAQQFVKSEDGRPLLGATKIDQLMLVIQARDKGNTSQIHRSADGSILGQPDNKNSVLPPPVNLVGGVDKPEKITNPEDAPDDGKKGSKRKAKNQQCPYCLKYFNQSTHLEVHVRSHIGHKPFECSYCHKRFTQGGNLRTHLRLHTGEKPFTCDICKRSFSRKGNLAAHQLTHNNLKPFECKLDDCDKSFTQLGNLKSHQNRFHLPTLNKLTHKLAELTDSSIESLPEDEKYLLTYFKELYKNSNKGIRGRGKRTVNDDRPSDESVSPTLVGGLNQSPNMNNMSRINQQPMGFPNPPNSSY